MTPELEAALAPLNWTFVKWRAPWLANSIERVLNSSGGLISADVTAAKKLLEEHRALIRSMQATLRGLQSLPKELADFINVWSCPPEARDAGIPDAVEMAIRAIDRVSYGLVEASTVLAWEKGPVGPGRPQNKAAYRIAEAVADAYVIGRGQKPRPGRARGAGAPQTIFGRIVGDVFKALEMDVRDAYPPCAAAVEKLDQSRMAELRAARTGERRFSLFVLVDREIGD